MVPAKPMWRPQKEEWIQSTIINQEILNNTLPCANCFKTQAVGLPNSNLDSSKSHSSLLPHGSNNNRAYLFFPLGLFLFSLTPPLSLNSEIRGCTRLLREPLRLRGKEVVFLEMEWPGFEPRTSSIRRGCSIHSTTPHLAPWRFIAMIISTQSSR